MVNAKILLKLGTNMPAYENSLTQMMMTMNLQAPVHWFRLAVFIFIKQIWVYTFFYSLFDAAVLRYVWHEGERAVSANEFASCIRFPGHPL